MSYYDVLGISSGATEEDIRIAHKQKSQETLMDTEAYNAVQTAFDTLIAPERRAVYDAELEALPAAVVNEQPKKSGTAPLRRSVTMSMNPRLPDEITRSLTVFACPVCTHQNSAGDRYCVECGFLLSSTPAEYTPPTVPVPSAPRFESPSGVTFGLKPGLNRVGRENADIQIQDKTVSRYHALVVFDEERHLLSVEDAGSSNGTRVNDFDLPPRSSFQLNDGDIVVFGSARVKLFAGVPTTPAEKAQGSEAPESPNEITVTLPPVETVPLARLNLQRGRGPQEVLLVPGTITIGRLPDNHVSLPGDRYASGHHAQVVVEETVFRLIDVGSTNGSFLNGLKLTTNESIAMSDGDELMIGSTVFQFQVIKKRKSADNADTGLSSPIEQSAEPADPVEALPETP